MIAVPDLITLGEIKQTRGLNDPSQPATVDDGLLIKFIHAASAVICNRSGRHFVPYWGVRVFDGRGDHLQQNRTCLDLDDDLLALTEATDDAVSVSSGYILAENANYRPYWRLRLSTGQWGGDATMGSITVNGLWGFHDDYDTAWEAVTTLVGNIDDAQTDIAVDALNVLSELAYIKVGDEFMQVTGINETDDLVTVRRAERGTTAAAALTGATVSVYHPIADIHHVCERLVSFYYDRRDTTSAQVSYGGSGTYVVESDLPPEITQLIDARRRLALMFM